MCFPYYVSIKLKLILWMTFVDPFTPAKKKSRSRRWSVVCFRHWHRPKQVKGHAV